MAHTQSPTYSGGASIGNCIYGSFSNFYSSGVGTGGAYYGSGDSLEYYYCAPGSQSFKSCKGKITVTFTWKADGAYDLPPKSVIVEQQCMVGSHWDGDHGKCSCDDGLGHSSSANPATASDTRYSVVNDPGTSFSVICSPGASFSHTGATGANGGGAYVNYKATASPVIVSITGTYDAPHGDYRVLTGQQITASLSGISGTITDYTWSIPSSTTVFKTYNENATSNQLVPLASADLTGPTPPAMTVSAVPNLLFYDRKQEDLTVKCDVIFLAPDNTVLSATGLSPVVGVKKPTASWAIDPTSFTINGQTVPNVVGFHDDSTSKQSFGVNTTWYPVTISVPSPFTGGQGCFAQIVTPSASITRVPTGTGASTYQLKIQNAQGQWIAPGTGLDGNFPYAFGFTTDASGHITGLASNSSWQVSGTGASGDNPTGQETVPDIDNGGMNWNSSSISDSFSTWLIDLLRKC